MIYFKFMEKYLNGFNNYDDIQEIFEWYIAAKKQIQLDSTIRKTVMKD